jgi:hypothetical protein
MTSEQFFAALGEPDWECRRWTDFWFSQDDPGDGVPHFHARCGTIVILRFVQEAQNEKQYATEAPVVA